MSPAEESGKEGQSGDDRRTRTHFLLFTYVTTGPYTQGEPERRERASRLVQDMGGSCEIFRISFNNYNMISIVRGLSIAQVRQLAEEINSWGAVQATVVETSGLEMRR
jgi:hypothetical protein